MNTAGHLTENQLSEYFEGTLEDKKRREIGRHLLVCNFCLKRLPQPTPEQFWKALMTENDVNDRVEETTDFSPRLGFVTRLFTPPKMLAWSAGGLAIALFFAVLIGFYAENPPNKEREVAEVFNVNNTELDVGQNEDNEQIVLPSVLPSNPGNNSASTESDHEAVFSKPKEPNSQKRKSELSVNKLSQNSAKNNLNREKINISSTRGGSPKKCSDENSIEMEIGSDKTQAFVFRWVKVPNAAKYHLYISDEEEILIGEYETGQETSFVLKKMLDPLKTYKWKIIVTLENGKTVVGDSKKFTVKDFQTDQKKPEKKRGAEIRCSANE